MNNGYLVVGKLDFVYCLQLVPVFINGLTADS